MSSNLTSPERLPAPDSDFDGPAPGEGEPGLGESLRGFFAGMAETLPKLVNRTWWWVTLLVLVGMGLLVWLGIWQLDRLDERRAFNTLVAERYRMEPYDLAANGLPADLKELEWRRVVAEGRFDYEHQIVLTNQAGANGESGVRIITPFVFDSGEAVLISRGWVPQDDAAIEKWPALEESAPPPVIGLIQESQTIEGAPVQEGFQREWYRIDIPAISRQMPYPIMSAFLMQLSEEGRRFDALPVRDEPPVLDEGSHLSYAIQWFTFAFIFGFGYIQFVRWQEERAARIRAEAAIEAVGEHVRAAQAPEVPADDGISRNLAAKP